MTLTAAASGLVIFLLSVRGGRVQDGWGVTYASTQICALKGSTVEMRSTYSYPPRINHQATAVERTLWFTKMGEEEDVRADPDYAGRVQYSCSEKSCVLRIRDLRESDSAEYKFRIITDQPGGRYTGSPGVTLTVTGLQVQMRNSRLECHSRCDLPGGSYIWYKNGQKYHKKTHSFSEYVYSEDSYSCAVERGEGYPSPSKCFSDSYCNAVTYTDRRICAFKGSSVDISCTYNSYHSIESKFWVRPERRLRRRIPSQHEDLREDPQYSGRVSVRDTWKRWEWKSSTLTITNLRESDSAEYHFKFKTKTFEWNIGTPGTTLTVTDPDVQVQVIWSWIGPKLVCHSSCLLTHRSSFVWYQNEKEILQETSPSYRGYIDPAHNYSCAYEGYRSLPVFAPSLPSVSVSPSGEIVEGSSVTLSCSSDANPAATYTWYKENQSVLSKEAQLVFSSIRSSDSGLCYCAAENELGRRTSENISVDVKYAPRPPSVSVSPSGEIVEGSSVTLSCSSDANPAATYTWYKGNQSVLQGAEGIYNFTSIGSEDRGLYRCTSENKYGQINSSSLFVDVQYAPRPPSVSVSPSGEIVEGSSVNLTCSSDANPAATYTWYKENEDSPKASGQVFTITDFRAEHSGRYYCAAENGRGRQNSTSHPAVVAGAWKVIPAATASAVFLSVMLIFTFLWITRTRAPRQSPEPGERPDSREQIEAAEQQDDLHYASVHFSNVTPAQSRRWEEDEKLEYTLVNLIRASAADGGREAAEDPAALYSTAEQSSLWSACIYGNISREEVI